MKKMMMWLTAVLVIAAMLVSGCAMAEDTLGSSDDTELVNPWTESDREGVAEATGFDMVAPEEATEVIYSYMEETGLAEMQYVLDDIHWIYRMQMTDELTDISGLYVEWGSELEGTVAENEAMYYGYVNTEEESINDVQLVNWYDAVVGVTYSLSASGTDLDGMDIQVFAEDLYTSLQGEATDDAEADAAAELAEYFLGEHERSDDGSTLTITDNGDGTYKVDISIYRLCSLEDGVGTFENHKMLFTVVDPSENELSGEIYRDADNSLVIKITDSTWTYLANDELLEGFGK